MRDRSSQPRLSPHRGFTLVEVLVAIFVLSFGVLSMLGLQAAALKSNMETRYQADAVRLAADLGELMSSNPVVASKNNKTENPYLMTCSSNAPCSTTVSTSATSSDKGTAAQDAAQWYGRLTDALPGSRVVVCYDTAPYDANGLPQWTCTNTGTVPVIKIGWTQAGFDGSSAPVQASSSSSRPGAVLIVGVCNPLADPGTACVS